MSHDGSTRTVTLRRATLGSVWAFTGLSVLGYATFGRHPGWLAAVPGLTDYYAPAFRIFSLGQVWFAWASFALVQAVHVRGRWLPAFAALYGISLLSELAGTRYGVPFGAYRYSELLEPMWQGRVPVAIPLSWFYMGVASYALARAAVPDRPLARVPLTAAVLAAWDLALDPAMSRVTAFWAWEEAGPYYGMPPANLPGWYLTGLALAAVLTVMRADRWIRAVPVGWYAGFYLANLLLPMGMNAAAGLWGAVLAPAAALVLVAAGARRVGRRSSSAIPVGAT